MREVKCECGHVNPYGATFCESCGKPFEETDSLDMRYEGTARRSITYQVTIVDQVWRFFSNVKMAVVLILITLLVSIIGTIYPQDMYIPKNIPAAEYYETTYGFTGKVYYLLGFNNLYGSWWYMLLVAAIGVSLVICSLDRIVPLYKALKNQHPKKHHRFIQKQKLVSETIEYKEEDVTELVERLRKRGYNIREENGHYLAEKGRFSRWGPYVNHIGLIIFLFGTMLRFVPGMYLDESMWVREGDRTAIVGTNGQYFIENHGFTRETYNKEDENQVFDAAIDRVGDGMIAKNFQSTVTLYKRVYENQPPTDENLKKVKDYEIKVNHPLKFDEFAVYQVDFKENEMKTMSLHLVEKATDKKLGKIDVDLWNPKSTYDLGNGSYVELKTYLPDFYFDSDGTPNTKSKVPNNPAFVFKMVTPSTPDGEVSFVAIRENIEPVGENKFKLAFAGIETLNVSGLTVKIDRTLWILGLGGTIFMIGLIQGMYWHHRRIWLHRHDGSLWIAGFTNKNWFGLRKELEGVLKDTAFKMPVEQR